MEQRPKSSGGVGISMWVIALGLVIVGVLLARIVRATLAPTLRPERMQIELHVVLVGTKKPPAV
jgi:hypothetical protein